MQCWNRAFNPSDERIQILPESCGMIQNLQDINSGKKVNQKTLLKQIIVY